MQNPLFQQALQAQHEAKARQKARLTGKPIQAVLNDLSLTPAMQEIARAESSAREGSSSREKSSR